MATGNPGPRTFSDTPSSVPLLSVRQIRALLCFLPHFVAAVAVTPASARWGPLLLLTAAPMRRVLPRSLIVIIITRPPPSGPQPHTAAQFSVKRSNLSNFKPKFLCCHRSGGGGPLKYKHDYVRLPTRHTGPAQQPDGPGDQARFNTNISW